MSFQNGLAGEDRKMKSLTHRSTLNLQRTDEISEIIEESKKIGRQEMVMDTQQTLENIMAWRNKIKKKKKKEKKDIILILAYNVRETREVLDACIH